MGEGWGERLSCWSSGLPWSVVSENGVKDREKLPRDRNESDHLRLAGCDQAIEEGLQDAIVPLGDHCPHEQGAAISLRLSRPSSGSSAIKVRAMVGPMPGTEASGPAATASTARSPWGPRA